MEVAYQGEPGCYSEAAAQRFFGAGVRCVPCASFGEAIDALRGRAGRAVIPVENVLAGSLHANLDLIVGAGAHVVGEVEVDVRHCLLVPAGANRDAAADVNKLRLTVARSHDMALRQCSEYLARFGIRAEVAGDTAGAARELAHAAASGATDGMCAIASEGAAKRYGLQVIARDIGNQRVNFTRFLILSSGIAAPPAAPLPGVAAKTSIVFALDQGPGRLCQALGVFAFHDIDLCRIESRHVHSLGSTAAAAMHSTHARAETTAAPARWQYIFYVDFIGSSAEKHVDLALQALQCKTSFYRLLGSYEMFDHRTARSSTATVVEDASATTLSNNLNGNGNGNGTKGNVVL